jgi:hypothetical protein
LEKLPKQWARWRSTTFWPDILNMVLDWENSRNARIHKGSLFYFWSQTAILQGQLIRASF